MAFWQRIGAAPYIDLVGQRRTPLERDVLWSLREVGEETLGDLLLRLRHEEGNELDLLGLYDLARCFARLMAEDAIAAGRDLRDGDWLAERLVKNAAGDWRWSSTEPEPLVTLTNLGIAANGGHVG